MIQSNTLRKTATIMLLFLIPLISFSQNSDNYATFDNINSVFRIQPGRNGLTESAFKLKARIRMERWKDHATIILDIERKQSTPSNPDPSYLHSYTYQGKEYGNQHVGYDPFIPIKGSNITYEVTVMYGSQSWTKKVDGMTNQFGPVDREAKASAVTVYVKVVNVAFFDNNKPIEDKIRGLLKADSDKKAAEEKKKQDDLKAAADKKAAEDKKVADAKKAAEDKKAADAKKADADKKTADAAKAYDSKKPGDEKTTAATDKAGSGSTDEKSTGSSSAKKSQTALADEQAAARQAAIDKKNAEREAEIARQKAEEERLQKRQSEYDSWKASKDKERAQADAASMAASFGVLTIVGGWIYNDKMGDVNPDYVYKGYKKKPALHVGVDWGYSASSFPVIFQSDLNTMRGGRDVNIKSLEKKAPFTINLDVNMNIGMDHDNYGGYVRLSPKIGFSPVFDAYNVSLMNYGVKVYGGLKWVKAYVDYGGGSRTFTQTSGDVEESGSAKSDMNYSKLEYGIRFTTNADADYRRSHISLGLISETLAAGGIGAFTDPLTNTIITKGKSRAMQGFAFQWKKDHNFNLYCNLYPEYAYSGDINYNSGPPSSDFKSTPGGGLFVEFGFLRSVDWW
jgi:hypothetical protein